MTSTTMPYILTTQYIVQTKASAKLPAYELTNVTFEKHYNTTSASMSIQYFHTHTHSDI